MSDLVPTVITDVNGKITTVHKRAVAEVMRKRKIPSPDTAPSPKMVTRQAMKDFEAAGLKVVDTKHGNKNVFHLAKFYPYLLRELMDRAKAADDREKSIWTYLISKTELANNGNSIYDMTPFKYRMWFTLLPTTLDLYPETDVRVNPAIAIQKISMMASILEANERREGRFADDDEYRRIKALMILIAVDRAGGGPGNGQGRDEEVNFINQHMESIEPLVPELMKRGVTDQDYILELINSSSKALNEGIL